MDKWTLTATAFMVLLLSTLPTHTASASPNQPPPAGPAPFGLLLAVLVDARDNGTLPDVTSGLLSNMFIEYLLSPVTGETPRQIRERLVSGGQTPFDFLVAVLDDANEKGSLPNSVSDLLSDLFIEYLIVPATDEAPERVRARLYASHFSDEGHEHYDRGDWKLAIENFSEAIRLQSEDPRHYQSRGWAFRQAGEYAKSMADFTKAIELNSSFEGFYSDRAHLHFLLDNYDKAIDDYTKAIGLSPRDAGLYVDRVWVYLEAGYHHLAIADFDKAIELEPDDEWLRENRPPPEPFPPSGPVRGIAGDLWADIILGKTDFSEIATNRVVPFKLFNPGGILVDRSTEPGRAYIWDSGNSRILGLDLAECYEGEAPCSAQLVIGQPSLFDHSACNGDSGVQDYPVLPVPTAETLCGISSTAISPGENHTFVTMAVSSDGDIFVPDSRNHRVLRYDSPFDNDSVADDVWGQSDFTGRLCNRGRPLPGPETLCFHSGSNSGTLNRYGNGVEVDHEGNLWVADGGNNRILRFPYDADRGEIPMLPDLVLGQPDFYRMAPGNSLDKFHAPSAVRLDAEGRAYVVDSYNDRVLVFDPPFQSGMVASSTFGSQFYQPTSLEVDPLNRGIWVNDSGNHMVELWNYEGTRVLRVLGKESYTPDRNCGESPSTSWHDNIGICNSAGSIAVDALGNLLVPAFLDTAEIFRYPSRIVAPDAPIPARPDMRFFYPPHGANFTSPANIHSSRGVVAWKDQLIVSDIRRLMFWNGLDALANGQPPDGVIGSEFFENHWPACCGRIKLDESGRLWVLGFEGKHLIDVYQLPLTEYSVPIHTIWPEDRTLPVLGMDSETSLRESIHGIVPVGRGDFLWLSDTDNHRVLRIRDPLTNPVVDVILGQSDHTGVNCNRISPLRPHRPDTEGALRNPQPDTICFPGALSIDNFGNLYVSDHTLEVSGNHRLLLFNAETVPLTNSTTLYGPAADKVFATSAEGVSNLWSYGSETDVRVPYRNMRMSAAAWEPAFDSSNRMIVGYNSYLAGRFVGVYDDPLGEEVLPNAYLYDFSSMPYTAAFDDDDNLYVGDINRGRVLVYHNPFDNPPRQETATTTQATPPIPQYTATIHSASPEPPQCVIATSSRASENTLRLGVEGISEIRDMDFMFQFRRVTGAHRERLYPASRVVQVDGMGISIDMSEVEAHHWTSRGKATLTLQITDYLGAPLSNWSPAFILAEDKESCERESPVPGLIPSGAQAANARLENFMPYTPHPSLYEEYRQRTQSPSIPPQSR